MTRTLTVVFLLFVATSAGADLRYATHVEARKLQTAAAADPLVGLLGGMLMNLMASGDTTTVIGMNAVRIETKGPIGPIPAGSAILLRAGSALVINPQDHTYWTLPAIPGDTMRFTGTVTRTARRGADGVIEVALQGVNRLGAHVTGTAVLTLPAD